MNNLDKDSEEKVDCAKCLDIPHTLIDKQNGSKFLVWIGQFDKIFFSFFLTMSNFLGNLFYAFGLKWEKLLVNTPKMNNLD